jgi:hypothetical protein
MQTKSAYISGAKVTCEGGFVVLQLNILVGRKARISGRSVPRNLRKSRARSALVDAGFCAF